MAAIALLHTADAQASCPALADDLRGRLRRVNFTSGNRTRALMLYVPQSLSTASAPGLLAFHGFHSNPWYFGRLIDITSYAERYGIVVGLPFGTSPTLESELCCPAGCDEACCSKGDQLDILRPCSWNVGRFTRWMPRVGRTDDVAMARAAVDALVREACVDRGSVMALGFSLGGSMMHRLACEASDVFVGVAAISGSIDIEAERCAASTPSAWIHFCGTGDFGCRRAANSTYDMFAQRHGCASPPSATYISATTSCEARSGCAGGAFVERCLIAGLGDEVPGHQRQVPAFVPQPATNVDAIKYALDRFSTRLRPAVPPPAADGAFGGQEELQV